MSRTSDIPHYFKFKAHLFSNFSELKTGRGLKFVLLFFTLRKSQKHFPGRTSGNAREKRHVLECKTFS